MKSRMNLLFKLRKSMFKRIFRRVEEVATKRKTKKKKKNSIFDMPDLNVLVLDPPTYSHHFDANCGKIRYMSGHNELNDI